MEYGQVSVERFLLFPEDDAILIIQSSLEDISPFDGTVPDPVVVPPQTERAFPTAPVAMLVIENLM